MSGKKGVESVGEVLDRNREELASVWDRDSFVDALVRGNHGSEEVASMISRDIEKEFASHKNKPLTQPVMQKLIEAKLMYYGIKRMPAVAFPVTPSESLPSLDLSPNAVRVLERRYLKKDEKNRPLEAPKDMFLRVAKNIAGAERIYDKKANVPEKARIFYRLMTNLEFLPNSPTLMNAGRELQQLSACFVLPVDDSMEGIFDSLKHAALIHKSGGGTGFSFSRLRPKNSQVGSTGGVASGPISFMRIFNTATEQVKQGGTRRGANMGILRVDHPDILEFIHAKENDGSLNNFNLSVGLTEAFMEAAKAGKPYDLVDPYTKGLAGQLDAKEVFDEIVQLAWKNGDPGIVFLDRLNRDNPTPLLGEIESTNPCGEQPLLPYEACNLGSINLARVVKSRDGFPEVDYEQLSRIVHTSVNFLDNVIDMSKFPLKKIRDRVQGNRKIGLGIMGWADLLIALNIPYNSERAIDLAEKVMSFIRKEARTASKELAAVRGAFPNFKGSIFDNKGMPKVRNATMTTIAPTGTLSIIANCSSGIEPIFALSYYRNVMDNDKLIEVNESFRKIAIEKGFYSEELMARIAEKGTLQGMEEVPREVREVFVTAHDVTPEWHIRMQAAFQKYTDNAVSKTVNFPHDATISDVEEVYIRAYETGCKGVTIYRDGSKAGQVLNVGKEDSERSEPLSVPESQRSIPARAERVLSRPAILEGFTAKMKLGHGTLYITVNEVEGKPVEVFATIGKSGQSTMAKTEAIGRLVSLSLRYGVPVEKIVRQLKGIGGDYPIFQKDGLVRSIPDAIARILERRYMKTNGKNGKHKLHVETDQVVVKQTTCPDCGAVGTLERAEGCLKCLSCGYSKCG
ncbi:MAG: vitamin B12-dependent ribonucleotide reductase [Deltaproteobacteria bacterium]|nr:vitamin B12-dependent ribonucleotide reductase [Deltaproteobacteria bacterium]